MPRKHKSVERDVAREHEVLNAPVNPTGAGEDPALKAVLSPEFEKMPDAEALPIALALQQLVRGQSSILAQQETMGRELSALRQRMNEYDADGKKWREDQSKFVEDVMRKAETVMATGDRKDRLIARGASMLTDAIQEERAKLATDQMSFDEALSKMPLVDVVWPGHVEMYPMQGGGTGARVVGEVVRIKQKSWAYRAGSMQKVPAIVAQVLKEREDLKVETEARQTALTGKLQDTEVAARFGDINRKHGLDIQEAMPIASR